MNDSLVAENTPKRPVAGWLGSPVDNYIICEKCWRRGGYVVCEGCDLRATQPAADEGGSCVWRYRCDQHVWTAPEKGEAPGHHPERADHQGPPSRTLVKASYPSHHANERNTTGGGVA